MANVFEIADAYVEESARLDPYDATLEGIPGYDDQITDYSPQGAAARAEHDRRTLRALEATPASEAKDRLAREVMTERLNARLALFLNAEHLVDLNVLRPPSGSIRQAFDLMPKESETDWQSIARRLRQAPQALHGFRETLDEGIRQGRVTTKRIAVAVAEQAETWSGNGGGSSFFHRLIEPYGAGPQNGALATDLAIGADATAAAYADFAVYLRNVYTPMAVERDGSGPERYLLHCRQYNGCDLDLRETYDWGWQELYRIEAEMRRTADRIAPGATPQEAVQILNTDPTRAIDGVDAYRDWLQQLHDQALADMDGVHFDVPDRIKNIEVLIPPAGGALAPYYTPPSEDFASPGRTWWPVASSSRFPRWDRVSIAYHEGVPGHHLQVGAVRCLKEALSRYQQVAFISGHGEGWALYSERLMGELGYLENPEYYLGMLSAQALRAVRVVVDLGLHLGFTLPASETEHAGEAWTYDLAVEFATKRANQTEAFMKSEVLRYLGWPAQAISYKVGERAWLDTRSAVKAAQGAAFDLKRFHSAAISLGPVGLALLEPEVLRALQ